jgi:hypothetical protein
MLSLNELLSVESACDLTVPIDSTVPRWQRKALKGTPKLNASLNASSAGAADTSSAGVRGAGRLRAPRGAPRAA